MLLEYRNIFFVHLYQFLNAFQKILARKYLKVILSYEDLFEFLLLEYSLTFIFRYLLNQEGYAQKVEDPVEILSLLEEVF
jgi:hypothetical protein